MTKPMNESMEQSTNQPINQRMSPRKRTYWHDNLRLVGTCLAIWFLVSFGFGILLLDVMNQIQIGGVRLGFWFAQQGSIYVFVALIFFYAWRMQAIDRLHGVEED